MVFKLMYPSYCDITVISFLSTFACFETDCSSARILYLLIALELENNFINKISLQSHTDFTIG